MKIAGISGSLRQSSTHKGILRKVEELLKVQGVEYIEVDVAEFPLYDQDLKDQGDPEVVTKAHAQLAEADAIVLASPEYNYSVSGVLKNAIDWFSRVENQAFNGKAVALMGASPGLGTSRGQYHLRQILVFLNAHIINKPEILISQSMNKFNDQGDLTDEKTAEFIGKSLAALIQFSEQLNK